MPPDVVPLLSRSCPDPVPDPEARLREAGTLPGQVQADPAEVRRQWQSILGLVDKPRPTRWTAELVADRLLEARATLARMPMATRPGGYKTAWPAFQGMSERDMQNLELESWRAGTLRDLHADRNRVRIPPSQEAIGRMEEALGWPLRFLAGDQHAAMIVAGWDGDGEMPGPVRMAFREIARGLNRDAVAVR